MGIFGGIMALFEGRGPDGRRTGRLLLEPTLGCNLGLVRDCSSTGLRVQSRRAVRGPFTLVRLWDDRGGLQCEARVVWSTKRGFMRYEAGLLLPPLDDREHAQLLRLVAAHRDRRVPLTSRAA